MHHRFRHHWQHFRPLRRRHGLRGYHHRQVHFRDTRQDQQHLLAPEPVQYICRSTDFFDCAEEQVVARLQRRPEVHALDRYIDKLQKQFQQTNDPSDGLVALLAQAPRAVLAQQQMDQFPHGYRNKQERLFELIDFNDTLVATILNLDDEHRRQFADRVKQAADRICKRVGAPCFSEEQWTSIIRGLTREVAVYLAAKDSGFHAFMTDRAQDALGIDLQVQDPEDRRYINIDVKTPSSFRRRMEQLVHEGRLTERELMEGDKQSYIIEYNGHGAQRVPVVVLCILPDLFGDLADWRFVNHAPMRDKLNQLIREHGLSNHKFGHYI